MPETTRLSGVPKQRISIDATAQQFAEWALTTHLAECPTCRTELCPAGRGGRQQRRHPAHPEHLGDLMSRIIITEFDGDSSEYDWGQPDTAENIGAPKGEPKHFRDGEEMLAIKHIVGLLDEGTHFNVRQWVD